MIANFFRSLSRRDVGHLLISGQASVLYGAATFSEDIDLWINAEAGNCERFLAALREFGARYYKLTPAWKVENLQHGHGFYFVLGCDSDDEVFLDVIGAPPRVGSFSEALTNSRWMETEWGGIRTIGLQSLVELKKTQRLEDYPIISKLALAWFEQPECAKAADDFRWVIRNMFTIPELWMFFEEQPKALELLRAELPPPFAGFAQQVAAGSEISDETASLVSSDMQRRMAELQQADRHYWRNIIADLKQLRAAGRLMSEGAEV